MDDFDQELEEQRLESLNNRYRNLNNAETALFRNIVLYYNSPNQDLERGILYDFNHTINNQKVFINADLLRQHLEAQDIIDLGMVPNPRFGRINLPQLLKSLELRRQIL